MKKRIKIGVLSPSNIAFRRTVPAILKSKHFEYVGVAHASKEEWGNVSEEVYKRDVEKCDEFVAKFGGMIFHSFNEVLSNSSIDAIYIPLPPSLHKIWCEAALLKGKHVIVEKPFSISNNDTKKLISLAKDLGLVVHENYAFLYHAQLRKIDELLEEGRIGELRFIRSAFSFPYRGENDFRYHEELGGGSIIDCGGYPLRLATRYLSKECKLDAFKKCSSRGHNVDVFGSATLSDERITAQVFWGMDNAYCCNLELYGSVGFIKTNRVFSPTADMFTKICLNVNGEETNLEVEPDDQFLNSINFFAECILGEKEEDYESIISQSVLIDSILGF